MAHADPAATRDALDRLQEILEYIDQLRQGDRQVRLTASEAGDDLARIESALDELGRALRSRDELFRVTQQASKSNLRRLDELLVELEVDGVHRTGVDGDP